MWARDTNPASCRMFWYLLVVANIAMVEIATNSRYKIGGSNSSSRRRSSSRRNSGRNSGRSSSSNNATPDIELCLIVIFAVA